MMKTNIHAEVLQMELELREWQPGDVPVMTRIWNQVLDCGDAFPGDTPLSEAEMQQLLSAQTKAVCACVDTAVAGLFILHPNNIGRCSHVANASYAVDPAFRGHSIGKKLVKASLEIAKQCGFRGMQFNAVVVGNTVALSLYDQLGFQRIGTIPGGFRLKDGSYSDMLILYHPL